MSREAAPSTKRSKRSGNVPGVKVTTLAIVGPLQHGVRMHASALADHTPQAARIEGEITEILPQLLADQGPVHIHFTDRIFGRNASEAAMVIERIAERRPVSVTLHDVPQPSNGHAFATRRDGYARVVAAARTVIVSSKYERELLHRHAGLPQHLRVHVDPLPIDRASAPISVEGLVNFSITAPTVGLLGFIYPGKGHEQVLAALASSAQAADVAALGRASDGHHDLVAELERVARAQGRAFHITGFLSEEQLTAGARAVTVPVVAPEHVSASGSVGRWIASGRRPIVTRHPFFEELRDRAPWALTMTDDLASALNMALEDPASTWIDERDWNESDVPSTARAAEVQWSRVSAVADGDHDKTPRVSVIVPYYENPTGLHRLLRALEHQDLPPHAFEVIVSDDGSAEAPALPATSYAVTVTRQHNLGFRAAAARNKGAALAKAPHLVFLDGDMMPEPGFFTAMLAGLEHHDDGRGVLAVGARKHVDVSSCTPTQIDQWLALGHADGARRLDDPAWLSDGYARTNNLADAGVEDFRLIISALMGVDRGLFERVGGFDETLTGYGGEDWDLAYRCWQAGSRFAHVPKAVAWHDGPDLGGRADTRDLKDAETMALAPRIPLPSTRGRGLVFQQPAVVVRVHGHANDGEAFLSAVQLLTDTDAGVWFVDRATVPAVLAQDPRVRAGQPESQFTDRCRYLVDVLAPLVLDEPLTALCESGEQSAPGLFVLRDTRRVNRGESDASAVCDAVRPAATEKRIEGRLGHG